MELFDFQEAGITQILEHEEATGDTSAMIGDDMGLGKTVEAIILDARRRKKHNCVPTAQTLVVTMTSVMDGWKEHFEQWAPDLKVIVVDRKDRKSFLAALKSKLPNGRPEYQVFICHWAGVRFMADELQAVKWFHVIGDEIQNIKNRKAQQTQAFKKVRAYYKTGLSGTWADNRPDDAWSPLNWLWKDKFRSYWAFYNHHVVFREKLLPSGMKVREVLGVHDVELIHSIMGNAYVRRTKEEVLKDLPDKIYTDIEVELDSKQRRPYDEMRRDMLAWVGKHEDQPIAAAMVVSQLVRLQQFACAYGKVVKRTVVKVNKDTGEKNKVLVEAVVLDEPSSKLDAVMEIVERTNGQVVVFAQSKQVINLLEARLVRAGISHGILTGDTKQADRDTAIQEFQSGRRRVFAGTIAAGGVGITLTAASTLVFIDHPWSPSKKRQAEDRIHRVGQKNACQIITLVARNTIDRKRNDQIELKWSWLKKILDPKKVEA
jgi:SNF2 family DNA or RNA helicase